MSIEDQIANRFRCAKCKNTGGKTRRIAATGTGISKLFDIQHNQFILVSCRNCGYTETYDPGVLEGNRHLGNIFDILFEP